MATVTPLLVEIEEWACKCQELAEELRGDPDDQHLECPACGQHFHGNAEYLDVGDPCPNCDTSPSSSAAATARRSSDDIDQALRGAADVIDARCNASEALLLARVKAGLRIPAGELKEPADAGSSEKRPEPPDSAHGPDGPCQGST